MVKTYCDICGKERRVESKNLIVSFGRGRYENKKPFDICERCWEELSNAKRQAELDFVKKSEWWKTHVNEDGDIDYGSFKMVGTAEQGGEMCPRCGHVNNAYIFQGTCQNCGYTEPKKKY